MPWLGPVREEYVQKLGLKRLQGLIGEEELFKFPRNHVNRPLLLREGYMRRLLLQEATLLNSPSSDIISAQPDLRYLSLAQTLKIRVIHADFDTRTATPSQSAFFTSLDNRLNTALIEYLGDPSVPQKVVQHFVLVFGARAYIAEKDDTHVPAWWLVNLPPHRYFVNTDTAEVASTGPSSVMAYRSYTRADPSAGYRQWQWQTVELTDGGESWTDMSDANEGTKIARKIGDEASVASRRRSERLARRRTSGSQMSEHIRRPSEYLSTGADPAAECEVPLTVSAESSVESRGDAQSLLVRSTAWNTHLPTHSDVTAESSEVKTTHPLAHAKVRSRDSTPPLTTPPQVASRRHQPAHAGAESELGPETASRIDASRSEEPSAHHVRFETVGQGDAREDEGRNLYHMQQKNDALEALVDENDEILDSLEKTLDDLRAIGRHESKLVDAYALLDKERVVVPTPAQEDAHRIVVPNSPSQQARGEDVAARTYVTGSPKRRVLASADSDATQRVPNLVSVDEDGAADNDIDGGMRTARSMVQSPTVRPTGQPMSPGNQSVLSWFSLSSCYSYVKLLFQFRSHQRIATAPRFE